jgi:hypothetical protein
MFAKTIYLAPQAGPAPKVIRQGQVDVAKVLRAVRRIICRKLVGPVFWLTAAGTVTLAVAGTAGIIGGTFTLAVLALAGMAAVAAGGSRLTRTLARLAA